MSVNRYEFRIYGAATSGVEHTVATSDMASGFVPEISGAMIDVLTGRSEARPWNVDISDRNDFFSSLIADTDGRMALLGRKVELHVSKDGGAFSLLGTGRLADTVDHVTHYTVSVHDERWLERNATVFTKQNVPPGNGSSSEYSGSILMPAGLLDSYGERNPKAPLGELGDVFNRDTNLAYVRVEFGSNSTHSNWNETLKNVILEDVKVDALVNPSATAGNFTNLRANVDGTDFEVASFDSIFTGAGDLTNIELSPAVSIVGDVGGGAFPGLWVVDPSATLSTGADVRCYLYTPSAEPTDVMPLHVGGQSGIHPFELLKDLYDEIGVQFSSAAMQTLIDDYDFGSGRWRIIKAQNLAQWVEDHIYGPYGVVPIISSSGAVVPTKVHLPQDITLASLPELTSSGLSEQPEWFHSSRERVTAIRFEYTHEETIRSRDFNESWPADNIREDDRFVERLHDTLIAGKAPRREVTYRVDGIHSQRTVRPADPADTNLPLWGIGRFADVMARERFERFGDGPIKGTCVALSEHDSIGDGSFARITLSTFPAPLTQNRGTTRIVQMIAHTKTPDGSLFEWLDAGPALNALVRPTVTLAQTVGDEKHAVDVTVSAISSGAGVQLQWAQSAAEPTVWGDWAGQGDSTGVIIIKPVPSGQSIWVRARATANGRIRSGWSTAANVTSEVLQAPSALASSSITGSTVNLDWALGSSDSPDYPLELRLTDTGGCPSTDLASLVRLEPRSLTFAARGLTEDSTHCFGVRHFDEFGGVSAEDTLTVQITTGKPTAPTLLGVGIEFMAGSECA